MFIMVLWYLSIGSRDRSVYAGRGQDFVFCLSLRVKGQPYRDSDLEDAELLLGHQS